MSLESYWVNTSETSLDIIHCFLGKTPNALETFEQLLADKTIDFKVNDNLTYHNIHSSGDNIRSALLEIGYFNKGCERTNAIDALKISNKCVCEEFN